MKKYLLVDSKGEFEAATAASFFGMAKALKARGAEVELFLVQNGVMPARAGATSPCIAALVGAGVTVAADEFSMRERAIGAAELASGISPAPIGRVVQRMADGWNILWH